MHPIASPSAAAMRSPSAPGSGSGRAMSTSLAWMRLLSLLATRPSNGSSSSSPASASPISFIDSKWRSHRVDVSYSRVFSIATAACAARSSVRSSSSSVKSHPPCFSVRYRFPYATPRRRIGTPRKLFIGGWLAGNPTERGSSPRSCSRRGFASRMSTPRIPRPRGRSPIAACVSGSMPVVRKRSSPCPVPSMTPSAAYRAPVS